MVLIHSTDENNIMSILKDKYLKSSNKTDNLRVCGNNKSKYIFLRLGKRNDIYGNMYLDNKLLLDNIFYLQVGWHGYPTTCKIDGRQLNDVELNDILKKFNYKINKAIVQRKSIVEKTLMSNEILVMKNVSLKKYLIKIDSNDENVINYCKVNYPTVKIIKY
jgi:hypothetical protein